MMFLNYTSDQFKLSFHEIHPRVTLIESPAENKFIAICIHFNNIGGRKIITWVIAYGSAVTLYPSLSIHI